MYAKILINVNITYYKWTLMRIFMAWWWSIRCSVIQIM